MASTHPSEISTSARRGAQDYFVTTCWTVVLGASESDAARAQKALAALCEAYWYPLYVYVRRRGHSPHDAEDLTQGFFARLLTLDSLAEVSPERGKFRAFLLASIKNYLHGEWDRASAQKRDIRRTLPLNWTDAENRYAHEPGTTDSLDLLFDRKWALALLDRALGNLRREYELSGRGDIFRELRHTIVMGKDSAPPEDLAARLGLSAEAIRVATHRLRKRFRHLLRDEIAETVADESEIDAEMAYLRRVLVSS